MNPFRFHLCLVVLSFAASLAACGPAAGCPDGFTALRDRCVVTPGTDGGPEVGDDADVPSDDAAPDDAGADDASWPDDAGPLDAGCAVELTYFVDADGDGAGAGPPIHGCVMPVGHVAEAGDCDDGAASRHPGAPEACNGADDDCDAGVDEGVLIVFYVDADGDGSGDEAHTREACTVPAGYAANDDDCDDGAASTHPGAAESCDGEDDDCDARVDEGVLTAFYPDCDGDDFAGASARATLACTEPAPTALCTGGWTVRAPVSPATTDCRIADPNAFPGQTRFFSEPTTPRPPAEPFAGGFDYDCDGAITLRYTGTAPAICDPGPTRMCGESGWTDGTPPACGVIEILATCGVVDCVRRTAWVAQPCH